ncbi:MAG: hypothetical protein ACI31F_08440 [Muribaculaceae bacterium]
MKYRFFYILNAILLLFIFSLNPIPCAATDWESGATISSANGYTMNYSTDNTTETIYIKGNVTMADVVQVGNNSSNNIKVIVEIHPDVSGPITISGSPSSFFRVTENCSLEIRGKSESQCIIFEGSGITQEMIGSTGTLTLDYVKFQNYNNQNKPNGSFYGVIKLNPAWKSGQKLGKTTITNCTFSNCSALAGTVLYTENLNTTGTGDCRPSSNTENTSESNAIWMENVVIADCHATGGDGEPSTSIENDTDPGRGWGGVIRFRGGWIGNFTMKNVEIKNCTATWCCAGVFWNAFGVVGDDTRKPVLNVIGCKFHDNHAGRSGGAMRIEGLCKFTEQVTEIFDNTAEIMGGGLHVYGYSAAGLGTYDVDYYLSDMLNVYNNKAQYGGGLAFQITAGCQLGEGSSFSIHYNGAKFNKNYATVKGGAVYIEDKSTPGKYTLKFFLNKGEINSNKVYKDSETSWNTTWSGTFYDTKDSNGNVTAQEDHKMCGGAVFLDNANIGYESENAGELTMNGNRCMRRGGAVYVTGSGSTIELNSLEANSNKAQDGGALTATSSCNIILKNMTLDDNESYGYGGATFIEQGTLTVQENAVISNSSAPEGAGIHARTGSTVTIENASIKGNTASSFGGGIYLYGSSNLNIENATISENTASSKGGGIYLYESSTLNIGTATLSDNTATERGGAIYNSNNSTVKIGNATISGNVSNYGGGIASMGWDSGSSGSFSDIIGNATFNDNKANISGGAIYLERGGKLEISDGATFTGNKANYAGGDGGGGAICVKVNSNTSTHYITATIKNATFRNNSAYRGGAIEIDGIDDPASAVFTLENNVMEDNVAKLGGAILVNEATLNYNGGKIRWNRAEYVEGGPKTSFGYYPYNWNDNCYLTRKFSGFGGGIIISKDAILNISKNHPFGIYENRADIAGNDISTVCSDWGIYKGDSPMRESYTYKPSSLSIPNAQNLDLTEFEVPVPKTAISWMEDYNPEDKAYSTTESTNKLKSGWNRYSELLKTAEGIKLLSKVKVDTESLGKDQKYLHLTLGYNFIFVKVSKTGLKPGETAIFRVWYKPDGSDYEKYLDFTLTGVEGKTTVERVIALTEGKWKIGETDWAFSYERPADHEVTLTQSDAEDMKEISFTNTKIENLHEAESIKVNKIELE